MDHEPTRWSRTARSLGGHSGPPGATLVGELAQQQHLVSQGYPVRIRRAFVAAGAALALVLGGSLAASITSGSASPESAPGDTVVTGPVSAEG